MSLISERSEIEAIAAAIARAPLVAFDLEFVSADRLVPVLCLVQVAWLDVGLDADPAVIVAAVPEVRLVDPIAGDVAPIVHALASHPLVVAHAPRQDLGLLATRFSTTLRGLVDTQLMAAFCGVGDQVGLATLANELLGLTLAKEMQWTDWSARPLSDGQLAYAAADVRHLPALYGKLAPRLGARLSWVREETALIATDAVAAASVTPETAWQQIGGARGLDPAALAIVVELAAWRQRVAIELDRPLGQVLTDRIVVDLARSRPDSAAVVRGVKGLSPHARTRADQIVAAIAAARPAPVATRSAGRASVRAQRWTEMLLAIVQMIAEDSGIAPRLLATRADADELARAVDEHGLQAASTLPALATWRRDVLGVVWEGWLTGKTAIVGDPTAPHGVRLLPRG